MMGLFPSTGIFIATAPVDLCKAFDGLAALVRQSPGHDPLSGSVYVFGNKRKDRIKILFWEPGGYWLCLRRLDDPEGAAAFYAGLFGWEVQDVMPAEAPSHYFMATIGGRLVAAVGSRPDAIPAATGWLTYIWVDSADDAVARARELGGCWVERRRLRDGRGGASSGNGGAGPGRGHRRRRSSRSGGR